MRARRFSTHLAAPFGLVARLILIVVFSGATFNAQSVPIIPAWIHAGLVVTYDSVSAFVNQGRFSQGVRVLMTTRVTAVSKGAVSGITQMQTVGTPLGGRHAWTCNAMGACQGDQTGFTGKFWVDPDHPTDSVRGPNGEPYRLIGRGPYAYGGRTWSGVMLSYQNPSTGFQYDLTFDAKSGLVLAYSETSPGQQVHVYFRAMSGR
ncbi:MAG TPA: hypothetical protein VEW69_12695 [Alphaproteobacteria bacterium]|nr:hypothetical protein [Alphaproteobacteria bacterium]